MMMQSTDLSPELYWLTTCTAVLYFKMVAISIYQGAVRFTTRSFHNAEDAKALGLDPATQEHPSVLRAAQAWRNDLENIPMFLIIASFALYLNAASSYFIPLIFTFTVARCIHTICYLAHLQPWRTISFVAGLGSTLALAILSLIHIH